MLPCSTHWIESGESQSTAITFSPVAMAQLHFGYCFCHASICSHEAGSRRYWPHWTPAHGRLYHAMRRSISPLSGSKFWGMGWPEPLSGKMLKPASHNSTMRGIAECISFSSAIWVCRVGESVGQNKSGLTFSQAALILAVSDALLLMTLTEKTKWQTHLKL